MAGRLTASPAAAGPAGRRRRAGEQLDGIRAARCVEIAAERERDRGLAVSAAVGDGSPRDVDAAPRDVDAKPRDGHPMQRAVQQRAILDDRGQRAGVGGHDVDARVDVAAVHVEHGVAGRRERFDAPLAVVVVGELGGDAAVEDGAALLRELWVNGVVAPARARKRSTPRSCACAAAPLSLDRAAPLLREARRGGGRTYAGRVLGRPPIRAATSRLPTAPTSTRSWWAGRCPNARGRAGGICVTGPSTRRLLAALDRSPRCGWSSRRPARSASFRPAVWPSSRRASPRPADHWPPTAEGRSP